MGLNSTSCTSRACQWNNTFKSKVVACKVSELQLTAPSAKKMTKAVVTETTVSEQVKSQMQSEILRFAKAHKCVYLTSVDETGVSSQNGALPFSMVKACQLASVGSQGPVDATFCSSFLRKLPSMFCNPMQLACLEKRTRAQRDSKLWYDHRQGRLTASAFGEIMAHVNSGQDSPSLLDRVVQRGTSGATSKAMAWGIANEVVAKDMVVGALGEVHANLRYEPVGLVIRGDYPHLGASPDGALFCDCDTCPSKRLLEIKCPFSIRCEEPGRAQCLDGHGQLRREHKYYAQVQGQMFLSDVTESVFAVYTENV